MPMVLIDEWFFLRMRFVKKTKRCMDGSLSKITDKKKKVVIKTHGKKLIGRIKLEHE